LGLIADALTSGNGQQFLGCIEPRYVSPPQIRVVCDCDLFGAAARTEN
jgi:hypothetical protein